MQMLVPEAEYHAGDAALLYELGQCAEGAHEHEARLGGGGGGWHSWHPLRR